MPNCYVKCSVSVVLRFSLFLFLPRKQNIMKLYVQDISSFMYIILQKWNVMFFLVKWSKNTFYMVFETLFYSLHRCYFLVSVWGFAQRIIFFQFHWYLFDLSCDKIKNKFNFWGIPIVDEMQECCQCIFVHQKTSFKWW